MLRFHLITQYPKLARLRDEGPLPINVISDMLGIPEGSREDIKGWSQAITGANMARPDRSRDSELSAFAGFVRQLAMEKRRNPGDDLTSQLVQAEGNSDRLTEQELFSMITLPIFAGHETTSNLIGLGTLALLDHPEQLARLQEDPSLIPAAVEEMLRFSTPVTSPAPHFATADVEMGGQRIRKGEVLMILLSSANRDHRQFVNAEEMNLTREENKHIAFGQGIHSCLGPPWRAWKARSPSQPCSSACRTYASASPVTRCNGAVQ